MAVKRPLVLGNDGTYEELQDGDTYRDPSPDKVFYQVEGANITALDVVYMTEFGNVAPARANSSSTMKGMGISLDSGTPGFGVSVKFSGEVTGFTGLVPGSDYYVSPNVAGQLVNTPISISGYFHQKIGTAKNSTTLLLKIEKPIKRG